MNITEPPSSPAASFPQKPLIYVGWKAKEDIFAVNEGATKIDYPGLERDVYIVYDNDTILISKPNETSHVRVHLNGNMIEIHREKEEGENQKAGDQDVKIYRSENEIRVDRECTERDLVISRNGSTVVFNRDGSQNDVKITSTRGNPMSYPLFIAMDGEVVELA
jgi:hypothetical protein